MATSMQPAQTYFDPADYQALKQYAKQNQQSLAAFLREAALEKFRQKTTKQTKKMSILDIEPISLGPNTPTDLALNHDYYLYGGEKKYPTS